MSMETDRIEADLNESRHRLNDTLEALGSKLSPGQMVDEVVSLARGGAGQFASALGRQIKENPVPAALIGVGIAWLVFGGRIQRSLAQDEEWHSERRYRSIEEARWATPRQPSETDDQYNERVHEAYSKALGLKQMAGEAAHEFKERVKRTAEGIQYAATKTGSRIAKTVKGTGRRIGNLASETGGRISHLASDAKTMAGEQYERLGRTASEARHSAERFYDHSPIAAGAIALAVGALIGGATPLSTPERRTLRGVADTVAKTGADLAERGARAVEDGVNKLGQDLDGAVH